MIHTYQKPLTNGDIGIVFGSFAPLHQGHLDLIMRAKKENKGGVLVIVCGHDGDKGEPLMPHSKRYRYVREFFADDELVAVYPINETQLSIAEYPNGWEAWMTEFEKIFNTVTDKNWGMESNIRKRVRTWYVAEQDYYFYLKNNDENVVFIDRRNNPVSGTSIRNNPIRYWDKITFPFKRVFSTNILICGTASEGKTTLVKDLGKYFNTAYSHEYARDYMEESNVSEWELDGMDYLAFLDGQYRLNKKMINSPNNRGVFFADSDSMTTRMYAEYYCKDPDLELTEQEFVDIAATADIITAKCRWDKIYLLCPKGEFVDDHSRYMACSGMDDRRELFNILCRNLKESGNWDKVVILDGGYWENFKKIVKDVKEILNKC